MFRWLRKKFSKRHEIKYFPFDYSHYSNDILGSLVVATYIARQDNVILVERPIGDERAVLFYQAMSIENPKFRDFKNLEPMKFPLAYHFIKELERLADDRLNSQKERT